LNASRRSFTKCAAPVRRAVLKRFPYSIHFLNEPELIVVLAVFHASRAPKEFGRRE
jgi:hypothetical protein